MAALGAKQSAFDDGVFEVLTSFGIDPWSTDSLIKQAVDWRALLDNPDVQNAALGAGLGGLSGLALNPLGNRWQSGLAGAGLGGVAGYGAGKMFGAPAKKAPTKKAPPPEVKVPPMNPATAPGELRALEAQNQAQAAPSPMNPATAPGELRALEAQNQAQAAELNALSARPQLTPRQQGAQELVDQFYRRHEGTTAPITRSSRRVQRALRSQATPAGGPFLGVAEQGSFLEEEQRRQELAALDANQRARSPELIPPRNTVLPRGTSLSRSQIGDQRALNEQAWQQVSRQAQQNQGLFPGIRQWVSSQFTGSNPVFTPSQIQQMEASSLWKQMPQAQQQFVRERMRQINFPTYHDAFESKR